MARAPIVFLDVDNTLLDNDAIQQDLKDHLERAYGRDMSAYLIDYPFAGRLLPSALRVLRRLRGLGPTVILSDGDVVFQPHKVGRAGLSDAVDGRVLIYIHKEEALDDVERRFPAEHYVVVDDKRRILAAVKRFWGERVTTVFARQGSHALDPQTHALPPADFTIERIGDLLGFDLPRLRANRQCPHHRLEPAR
jgi:FMN phosphatase YigB (HAD superfamily)